MNDSKQVVQRDQNASGQGEQAPSRNAARKSRP